MREGDKRVKRRLTFALFLVLALYSMSGAALAAAEPAASMTAASELISAADMLPGVPVYPA